MNKIVIFRAGVILLFLAVVGAFIVRPALALVDASSSPPVDDGTTTVSASTSTDSIVPDSASSTDESVATNTEATAPAEQAAATPPTSTPPAGLTEVHIIGTKYTDYFTDGTTVTSYPGDPAVDSHFSEPNAPIPTHEGLTWVHTVGQPLYDTPSGDLEVGDYAVQSDGSYIEKAPPPVSSTSTPESISSPEVPSPTVPVPSDSSSSPPDSTSTGDTTDSASPPPAEISDAKSASTTGLYSRIRDLFDDVGR